MIILIGGSSHVGKTLIAQKLLERTHFPYISLDHLKMGFIRSGRTELTVEDDYKMRYFLWPFAAEMIKTAIENNQNMIVEGCYIPFDWRRDFSEDYLQDIRFICLALTDRYIDANFDKIKGHASDIESRLDESYCTADWIKADNKRFIEGFAKTGEHIELIDSNYEQVIEKASRL